MKIALSFLLFFICSLTFADTNKEIAKCAIIKGDLERLNCFEKLAKVNKLDGPQQIPTPTDVGNWIVADETNPIDDTRKVTLFLKASSGQSGYRKPIGLIAQCVSGNTDLYINWNDYLGSNEVPTLIRVGKSTAKNEVWAISTNKQAAFSPTPLALLKQLVESETFLAQVTPYNESPVTAIFDLTGLKNAIKPLQETCKWSQNNDEHCERSLLTINVNHFSFENTCFSGGTFDLSNPDCNKLRGTATLENKCNLETNALIRIKSYNKNNEILDKNEIWQEKIAPGRATISIDNAVRYNSDVNFITAEIVRTKRPQKE